MRALLFFTTLAATCLSAVRPAAGQARPAIWQTGYAVVALGPLDNWTEAEAAGISASGEVAGTGTLWIGTGGYVRGFRWNGAMADLGTLLGNQAGPQSSATAISPGGRIVGWSYGPNGLSAFLWQDGTMLDIHSLGVMSSAQGVNDAGQVVGQFVIDTTTWETHAFLWQNGVMTDLNPLGASHSVALGINANGQVVGWYIASAGDARPFVWQNGVTTDLPTLGAAGSAYAINTSGQIVGSIGIGSCVNGDGVSTWEYHAALWEQGVLHDLGSFGCGYGATATSINNAGKIVGTVDFCDPDLCGPQSAFLYANGVTTDLNTIAPGLGLHSAAGINDNDQIVANGLDGPYLLNPDRCRPAGGFGLTAPCRSHSPTRRSSRGTRRQ
jgi:probable HAF family extracellular repeat protein